IVGPGDLANRVSRVDKTEHPPLLDSQVDAAQPRIRPVGEAERCIQVGDLLPQPFRLLDPAATLHDHALEINRNENVIGRGKLVGVKAEDAVGPGEETADDVEDVVTHALDNVALRHVPGLYEQMAELFVAHATCLAL